MSKESEKIPRGFELDGQEQPSRLSGFIRRQTKKVAFGAGCVAFGLAVNYAIDHYVEGISAVPRPPIDGECTGSKLDSIEKTGKHTYEVAGMIASRSCIYVFDGKTGVVRTSLEVGDTFGVCPPNEEYPDRLGVSVTPRRNNGYVELTENAQKQVAELKPPACFSIDLPWN